MQFAAVSGGELNYDTYSLSMVPALFLAISGRFWNAADSRVDLDQGYPAGTRAVEFDTASYS